MAAGSITGSPASACRSYGLRSVTWRHDTSPTSMSSPTSTSAREVRSTRSLRPSLRNGSRVDPWCYSTCVPRRSSVQDTSPARVPHRSTSSTTSRRRSREARSSPIAVARTASTRTTQFACCKRGESRRGGSMWDTPNGSWPAFPSSPLRERRSMLLRPFLNDAGSCASYLFGCTSHKPLAVVDPHVDLVDGYIEAAERSGSSIVAVFETHVQADHLSGLPALVERTGATPYLPSNNGVAFRHVPLEDGQHIELGNTIVTALATPGHAPAHSAFVVADLRRGSKEPWLVFTGDSLLIGDVGRPDLHVAGESVGQARLLHASLSRLLELPDHVVVFPSHYGGSVFGPRLSGNPLK